MKKNGAFVVAGWEAVAQVAETVLTLLFHDAVMNTI